MYMYIVYVHVHCGLKHLTLTVSDFITAFNFLNLKQRF